MANIYSRQRSALAGRKSLLPTPDRYNLGLNRPPTISTPGTPEIQEPVPFRKPVLPDMGEPGGGSQMGFDDLPTPPRDEDPAFSPTEIGMGIFSGGATVAPTLATKGLGWLAEKYGVPLLNKAKEGLGIGVDPEGDPGHPGFVGPASPFGIGDPKSMGFVGPPTKGGVGPGTGLGGVGDTTSPGSIGSIGGGDSNTGRDSDMSGGSKDAGDPDGGFW